MRSPARSFDLALSSLETRLFRPVWILVAVVASSAFAGLGIARLEIDSSIRTMLVESDPAYAAHSGYEKEFGSDEILSVAIPFKDPLSRDALLVQSRLVERLEPIEGVVEVVALVSQYDAIADGEDILIRPLVKREGDRVETFLEQREFRQRVRGHPIWNGWLVSEDLSAVALQIELETGDLAIAGRTQTLAAIESVINSELGSADFFLAGHPFMKQEIASTVATDLATLLPLSLMAIVIMLFALTRSLWLCVSTSGAVMLSVVWMMGAMGWLGLGVTALTNAAPTILIALSAAYYLHLTAAFQSSSVKGRRDRALSSALAVATPMVIAATTTAAGFASLYISSVPIVREFGLSLAVGTVLSCVVGLTALPAFIAFIPEEQSESLFRGPTVLTRFLFRVARFDNRFGRLAVAVAIPISAALALAASQIEIDSSGPQRFSEDSRYLKSSNFYREVLSGDVVESVYLRGMPGTFTDPARLRSLKEFSEAALQLPAVDKVISIQDYIARTFWAFRGEEGEMDALPDSREAVSQLLLLYESSGDLEAISDFVSSDRSSVHVLLKADVQSSQESGELRRDLEQLSLRFFPEEHEEYSVVSTEMLLSRAADVVATEQLQSVAIAVCLILVLVAFAFRSIRIAGLMILPNTLPLLMHFGGMSIVGIALSDATSIIAATSVGIAVDGTVHLVSRVREAANAGASNRGAVLFALVTAGPAVVATGIVVVFGFAMLMFSDFRSVAMLGALTALTMLYCLIADLVLLPSQMLFQSSSFDGWEPVMVEFSDRVVVGGAKKTASGVCLRPYSDCVGTADFGTADRVLWLDHQRADCNVEVQRSRVNAIEASSL